MRQFVSSRMPDSDGRIALSVKEFRYLSRVLRLSEGSSIDVRLPGGALVQMKLRTDKTENVLEGETFCRPCAADVPPSPRPAGPDFWLFQFLPKVQKADLIVRQATECGVSRIIPIRGEYSPPYMPRIDRWQRIIREARQQSGSPIETQISDTLSVREAASLWEKTVSNTPSLAFVLCEREEGQESLFTHIRRTAEKISPSTETIHCTANRSHYVKDGLKTIVGSNTAVRLYTAFAAGCEGGISASEKKQLEQSGFVPIHFKTNILRSETAALYGLAAIQSALTEYKAWKSKE